MSTLSQHKAIHSAERPYICEICNKTFNRVSTLISHRKTHNGLKPHKCHICNKAFHQKGTFNIISLKKYKQLNTRLSFKVIYVTTSSLIPMKDHTSVMFVQKDLIKCRI